MSDLLHDGVAWLAGQAKQYFAQSVTYTRPGLGDSPPLLATIGQTPFRTGDDRASRIEWSEVDFLLTSADLVVAGQAVTPRPGDRITWSGQGIYEVQPYNGEQHYRTIRETMVRIHTKRVGAA